jgi:two-component system OmpR family response regulator
VDEHHRHQRLQAEISRSLSGNTIIDLDVRALDMHLLLLEDDPILGEGLHAFLRSEGHVVDWFRRLNEARSATGASFDAMIVDWQLPDGSGVEWVRSLRLRKDASPVLMITAKDQLSDRIQGLDSGTDDYLVKPFAPEELVARLRAIRRRAVGMTEPRLAIAGFEVDLNARAVYKDGELVTLTAREWALLEALVLRKGRIVSKQELEDLVVGMDSAMSSNALEVHVSNLRRKLGKDVVETIRGLGYRISP